MFASSEELVSYLFFSNSKLLPIPLGFSLKLTALGAGLRLVSTIFEAPASTFRTIHTPPALCIKPASMRYFYSACFALPAIFAFLFFKPVTNSHPELPIQNPSEKVMAYFKHINLASRAIYDNDFVSASGHYDEAFKFKAAPFYLDLKNAIIVNSKCGFYAKNNALLKIILQQKSVTGSKLFDEIPQYLFDAGNLETIRNLVAQTPKSSFDPLLHKAVLQLFNEGQAIGGFDQIDMIPDEKERNRLLKQAYQARDSLYDVSALKFMDLVKKSGFPNEDRVGFFMGEYDIWFTLEILIHGWLWNKPYSAEVLALVETEFKAGHIPANFYANCLEYAYDNWGKNRNVAHNVMNATIIHSGTDYYRPFVFYSDSLMNLVNSNRLAIGLDSFHIAQRQLVCTKFCPNHIGKILSIIPHHKYVNIPYGFVKNAFKEAGIEMETYRIDIRRITEECRCGEKGY